MSIRNGNPFKNEKTKEEKKSKINDERKRER